MSGGASIGRPLDLNVRLICPDCRIPTPNLREDHAAGDLVCGDCGLVLGDRIIDTRSEWRTFNSDGGGDDPSRVGGPANPLLGGDQLDTIISARDGHSGMSKELSRIQNRSTMKTSERSLVNSFRNISTMCERISLPRMVADRAKHLYKLVDDDKLMRGKSNDGIIAACIYVACRQEKVPRTFKEISSLTRVPKKEVGRCYKTLMSLLKTDLESVQTEDFVSRFCSHLNLGIEVQKIAVTVIQRASEIGDIAGKSPITIAASAIFLVSHLFPSTQRLPRDIAAISGVSEVTIKNTYRDMYAMRHRLIPRDSVPQQAIDALPLA